MSVKLTSSDTLRNLAKWFRDRDIKPSQMEDCTLVKIELPNCGSRIVRTNSGHIFASLLRGGSGLFNKNEQHSRKFGRELCDSIKSTLCQDGFISSDELPAYGFSKQDTEKIRTACKTKAKDVVLIYAFDYEAAKDVNRFLRDRIREAFEDS